MNLKQRLAKGYEYLNNILNEDGGIPAISESDVSGVWTTAEALEAIITVSSIPHERYTLASRMWEFLLDGQLHDGEHDGAWPLVKLGKRGSAMATGNAVTAISKVQAYFGSRCPAGLGEAAVKGLAWLEKYQAQDGGWGVEPSTSSHGSHPRMIATTYAIAGFTSAGFTVETSQVLRKAKQWLLAMRDEVGGFRGGQGHSADPCNTSRAIRALVEMRAITPDDKIVHSALRYIEKAKPKKRLWLTTTESFVIEGSSGEVVFNSNTPYDALLALLLTEPTNPLVLEIVQWYEVNQQTNGSWALTPDDPSRSHICTWSTNEAVIALGQYEWQTIDFSSIVQRRNTWTRRVIIAVALALILETLILLNVNSALVHAWDNIPKPVRSIVLISVILAILVNLSSSFIYDLIGRRKRQS